MKSSIVYNKGNLHILMPLLNWPFPYLKDTNSSKKGNS